MNELIQNTIQPLMAALVMAIITVVGAKLTQYLHAKTGIELDAATVAKAENAATQAVMAVEEKAAAQASQKLAAWTSSQKHQAAINMIISAVPTITQEQANNLVSAALAKVPGLGASGDLSVVKAPATVPTPAPAA